MLVLNVLLNCLLVMLVSDFWKICLLLLFMMMLRFLRVLIVLVMRVW